MAYEKCSRSEFGGIFQSKNKGSIDSPKVTQNKETHKSLQFNFSFDFQAKRMRHMKVAMHLEELNFESKASL